MNLDRFPRVPLLEGITPIQRLTRLERALETNIRIHVKRDDLTGIGGGGNKLRKLEFLLGDALLQDSDTFITVGARQSNHARLTAAAAARAGMACELVLANVVDRHDVEYRQNGNLLLDGIFGAMVHEVAGSVDPLAVALERAAGLKSVGRKAYVVGSGGSSPVGCLGYASCAAEIVTQEEKLGAAFDRIVIPNGSAGTQAGLVAGFASMGRDPTVVRAFAVLRPAEAARHLTLETARETLALLGSTATLSADSIVVDGSQLGQGYGVPTPACLEAIRLLARTEGLLVDPVYGGKAFAGVLADIRRGRFGAEGNILFVMTGGAPGLFAYRPAFA